MTGINKLLRRQQIIGVCVFLIFSVFLLLIVVGVRKTPPRHKAERAAIQETVSMAPSVSPVFPEDGLSGKESERKEKAGIDKIFREDYLRLAEISKKPQFMKIKPIMDGFLIDLLTIHSRNDPLYTACIDESTETEVFEHCLRFREVNLNAWVGAGFGELLDELPSTSPESFRRGTILKRNELIAKALPLAQDALSTLNANPDQGLAFHLQLQELTLELARAKELTVDMDRASIEQDMVFKTALLWRAETLVHDVNWQLFSFTLLLQKGQPQGLDYPHDQPPELPTSPR